MEIVASRVRFLGGPVNSGDEKHPTPGRPGNNAAIAGKVAGMGEAAAKLGMPPSTLDSKIKQLRIKKDKFRTAI